MDGSESPGGVLKWRRLDRLPAGREPGNGAQWNRFWHGLWQLNEVRSPRKYTEDSKTHSKPQSDLLGEEDVERQVFLHAMASAETDVFSLVELGAGRGDWTLAGAGVVRFQLLGASQTPAEFLGIAVEAEPQHYEWTRLHLEVQSVDALALHAAVSNKAGYIRFDASPNPADNYGQSVRSDGNIVVPAITIDQIVFEESNFPAAPTVIHMDIQGSELFALFGSKRTLVEAPPQFLIVATHARPLAALIKFCMSPLYRVLLSIKPAAGLVITPLGRAYFPADGLLFFVRRRRGFGKRLCVLLLALLEFLSEIRSRK